MLFEILKGNLRVKSGKGYKIHLTGSFVELDLSNSAVNRMLADKKIAHVDRRNKEVTAAELIAENETIEEEEEEQPVMIAKPTPKVIVAKKPLHKRKR